MYNRYVPQPDGSFRRNQVQEAPHKAPAGKPQPASPSPPCPEPACPPPQPPCTEPTYPPPQPRQEERIGSFLRNLLPKDLDTGDLLIILLLLLMAGDREEERSNALLTLALYLFL